MFVGQNELQTQMHTLLKTKRFPRVSILCGPTGHGKKSLIWEVFPTYVYIRMLETKNVDAVRNLIEEAQLLRVSTMFVIPDAQDMMLQAQNAILKFAEEPPSKAYLMFTTNDLEWIIPTIRSRSQMYVMKPYLRDELAHFTNDKDLLELAVNPGQIQRLKEHPEIKELAIKVIHHLSEVSAANTFKVLNGVQETEYDILILHIAYQNLQSMRLYVQSTHIEKSRKAMRILGDFQRLIRRTGMNKRACMEQMLLSLREALR